MILLRRGWPILLSLVIAAAVLASVLRDVTIRSDMADFLPIGETEAARLMLGELRSGAATSLILVGIEGAPAADLARISRAMGERLGATGLFTFVNNGTQTQGGADENFLFENMYLLSPATKPDAFTAPALHTDLRRLLAGLQSSAAPLVQRYGLTDPPGAFLELAKIWLGGSAVRSVGGVWFAPGRDRALLLARTRAGGLDFTAQDVADTAIRAAFDASQPGIARLLVSGPAIFARDAALGIRSDVRLLSICSTLLVASLLLWRFRSPLVIAAIGVPILLSIAAAALAVQAAFGFVHGITLGFGMTMLGISVDYPVLLIGHRKRGELAAGTLKRIGFSFNLAVLTASLGLLGMVFSGFPGIAQLGLFAVVGLLAAAAATRWIMPRLIVAADLAPVSAGDPERFLRVERARRYRLLAAIPVLAAILVLALDPPELERDLANLSPVSQHARDLDAELRAEVGAPDVGQVVIVRANAADEVLADEEAVLPALDRLERDGAIGGAEIAARFLPSLATQRARIAALPPPETLAANLAQAGAGLPFKDAAFQPFRDAVENARKRSPLVLADMSPPLMAARLQPLLFARDGAWFGFIIPRAVKDPRSLAAFARTIPNATYVDIRGETNAMVAGYTGQAWRWLSLGGVAALVVLAAGLRDAWQVARVLAALAAAGLVTVAVLALAGQRISLLHIVSLQLVAGVGLDYALFFARRQLDAEERARTLRTLVTCNAMTLLTFGLLAFCATPLLREIGLTVAVGAFAAISFTFMLVGPARPGRIRLKDV